MKALLEDIYGGNGDERLRDVYVNIVGRGVKQVADWRHEQLDKMKKKLEEPPRKRVKKEGESEMITELVPE